MFASSTSAPPIISFVDAAKSMKQLQQAQAHMLKTGILHNSFPASRLIASAAATLPYAHSLFTEFPNPNTFMYNTMIRAYAQSPNPAFSLLLFLKLLCDEPDVYPDKYSFTFVLKACANFSSFREGRQIHALALKNGLCSDVYICNTLVHMYAKCGCFETARCLLNRMPMQDAVSWNAVLSVYVEMGLLESAISLFHEMPDKNLESWNFLLSGYMNGGMLDEARGVFDEMETKDVVSWNILITGYANACRYDEVLLLFKDMQRAKVEPDDRTIVTLLSSCAAVGSLAQGEWICAYIDRKGMEVSGFIATGLVDMYAKFGCIDKALEVFHCASRKDVSTWNAMIAGLSVHGRGRDAIEVFSEMVSENFKPNEVTFISLLSACSRAGLLFEAQEIFSNMFLTYGMEPKVEHYGCMVDLLGRSGLLEEAAEFVDKVPVKEANVMWESLLSSCRSHGNMEMAEKIAMKLLESNHQDNTGHVQLSNIHASKGHWGEVSNVRKKMMEKQMVKEAGGSLIEVNGIVHEFLAGQGMISDHYNVIE